VRLRHALWPSPARPHAGEVDRYFAGTLREPSEALLAFDERGEANGLIELSIRAYAEGCATDRVAFVEGWYVESAVRRQGVGTALIRAAEEWARSRGCTELASDAEVENASSAAAHLAAGFTEAGVVRCFSKLVPAELMFSYGTLQLEAVQLANFGRRLTGKPDVLPGFEQGLLKIDDPATVSLSGKTHHAIARFTGRPSDTISGTVYLLTAAEVESADQYEVEPYTRVSVLLQSGVRAWVYVDAQNAPPNS
jgi:GNAT superfamily N-acetyltransferase